VIPVFLPHLGCPHRCLFCDQHAVSGQGTPLDPARVQGVISRWLQRCSRRSRVQVAFYGGSFTALPRTCQDRFLAAVKPWLARGIVQQVRISTRPDCLDAATMERLVRAGVAVVELGVQSMDPQVLELCRRGHTPEQVVRASGLVRKAGISLGHQLMLGLPGQDFASLRQTLDRILVLAPDFVRIYPVLVLRDAPLAEWLRRGRYRPLTLERAVAQAAWLCERLERAGIRVVRLGLQPGPELENDLVAGPHHPAFGELVRSRILFRRVRSLLAAVPPSRRVRLAISSRDLSLFRGQGSVNIRRLTRLGLSDRFSLQPDPDQERYTVRIID